MKTREIILLLFITLLLTYCSSSQQTTDQDNSAQDSTEVYVFDAIDTDSSESSDTLMNEATEEAVEQEPVVNEITQPEETVEFFIVQVGAFSSEERAKRFIEENKAKIEFELTTHLSEDVNLYVVQLPPFRTRKKAEEVRDQLWTIPVFKDSFIVPK